MEVTKDSWVRLADGQCGKVVSIQGTRARVQIRGSANMVWREKPLVQLIFKGRPKSTAAVGDYVKLGSDVGVVVGIEGGRVQVEFLEGMLLEGGKKVWREFKDVVLNASGKDATSEYDDVGHSNTANKMMKEYFIGEYEGGDSAPEGSAQANASPGAFQTLMQFLLPLAIILLALYVRNMTQQK